MGLMLLRLGISTVLLFSQRPDSDSHSFNPIAPSLLTKALQALLSSHYSSSSQTPPSRDVIDTIVETSNGDIRSAIMALQFACVVQLGGKRRKKKAGDETSLILESVTRREQSLVLFHLMGKVLYNKRQYLLLYSRRKYA